MGDPLALVVNEMMQPEKSPPYEPIAAYMDYFSNYYNMPALTSDFLAYGQEGDDNTQADQPFEPQEMLRSQYFPQRNPMSQPLRSPLQYLGQRFQPSFQLNNNPGYYVLPSSGRSQFGPINSPMSRFFK